MRRANFFISCLAFCFVVLILFQGTSYSQNYKLVLRDIIHKPNTSLSSRLPENVKIDVYKGTIEFSVEMSGNCKDNYQFEYNFNNDMSVLDFGKDYNFNINMNVVKNGCAAHRNPYVSATSTDGGFSAIVNELASDKNSNYYGKFFVCTGGGFSRLYARPQNNETSGNKSASFKISKDYGGYEGRYTWIAFTIEASSDLGYAKGFYYDVVYIYQKVSANEVVDASFDCPPPDCADYPGTIPVWNFQTKQGECWCPEGTVWDKQQKKCVVPAR